MEGVSSMKNLFSSDNSVKCFDGRNRNNHKRQITFTIYFIVISMQLGQLIAVIIMESSRYTWYF